MKPKPYSPWSFGRTAAAATIALAITASGGIPRASHAQTVEVAAPATPVNTQIRVAQNRNINQLKGALAPDVLYWEANRRGPLLAVAPDRVYPWRPRETSDESFRRYKSPDPLRVPPEGGLRAEVVAPYFGRKIIYCGSLAVLAPTEMVVLATRLPTKPDPMRGLSRQQKSKMLQASLTAAQWRILGSEQGLGANDLDPNQRTLFLSLLPNPFRVIKGKVHEYGGIQVEWGKEGVDDPRVVLSEAQRNNVRIRMNRTANYRIINTTNNQPQWEAQVTPLPVGAERWQLNNRDEGFMRNEQFDVKLRDWVPSRLKQGEIDFDAVVLDAVIPVAGKKTVADLIAAVREKTGVEIYVDGRAGKQTVGWGGREPGPVRAGDLLKALCWALTGAFRKVGPDEQGKYVYLLTDDVEGIGTRRTRIQAWLEMGQAQQTKITNDLNKKILKEKPLQYLSFAPDDKLAAPPKLAQEVEEAWKTQRARYDGVTANLADLTAFQQEQVRASIERFQKQRSQYQNNQSESSSIYTDRVKVSVSLRMTYVVPGIGEIESNDAPWDSLTAMLPPPEKSGYEPALGKAYHPTSLPVVFPPVFSRGAMLCLAPTTADEASSAVAMAKRRGFRQLWVVLPDPDSPAAREILKAAGKAGKEQSVPVCAAFRLMRANDDIAAADTDNNILGESGMDYRARRLSMPETYPGANADMIGAGNWLRPDSPLTAARLTKRLNEIAAIPGIVGIVLRETGAGGYTKPATDGNYRTYGRTGSDFGYTTANRVALIRRASYDPIDLQSTDFFTGNVNLFLPNFTAAEYYGGGDDYGWEQTPGDVLQKWNGVRYEKQAALLKALYTAFRAAHPDTPLYVSGTMNGPSFIARWDNADSLPTLTTPRPAPPGGSSSPVAAAGRSAPAPAAPSPAKPVEPPKPPQDLMLPVTVTPRMLDTSLQMGMLLPTNEEKPEPFSTKAFSLMINSQLSVFTLPAATLQPLLGGMQRPAYQGVVLDLSSFPVTQALNYVEAGIAPQGSVTASVQTR